MSAVVVSIGLMVAGGAAGPSAAVAQFPAALPWPPWFATTRAVPALVPGALWLALLLGGGGLVGGLTAVRRGWRPRPRSMVAGSLLAVIALMVMPPMGSADMLDYAVFGRIAMLGHSPYVMTPGQLKASGDPVGAVAVIQDAPSRYGPVATLTEKAASELGGASPARTIFWLKVWNGLAYLALVLVLDRLLCSDARRRVRAHLLWSLNPLMLWAVMAGGHNDGLAVGAGATALFALRRSGSGRALLAGALVGVATAIKAPFALFGMALAWTMRRSPRALVVLLLAATAVVLPGYLWYGRAAISATMDVAAVPPVGYTPWFALARVLRWHDATGSINTLGLLAFLALAIVLVWRLPPGPREFPAVRLALGMTLALLVVSPQQRAWYDAMIFPILAVFPMSRLDWVVVGRAIAGAVGELPSPVLGVHPSWLFAAVRAACVGLAPVALVMAGAALLWLCATNNWRADRGIDGSLLAGPVRDSGSDRSLDPRSAAGPPRLGT